jgi:uncharacterized protein (TIGR03067 family)
MSQPTMATDLDKLQGTWTVTSLESDGKKMPAKMVNGAQIVIQGRRFTSIGMGTSYEGTVQLRKLGKDLKGLDLLFTDGPPRGKRNRGIYRLQGDTWTICLSTDGGKRPSAFTTEPGSGLALETLERRNSTRKPARRPAPAKPSADADAAVVVGQRRIASSAPPTAIEGEWDMVSAVFNGAPMDESMVQWCRRITQGDITTVVAGPQTMLKARFTLDGAPDPRHIDYVGLHGATKGKSQAGIYELRGNSLKICMAPPGKERPEEFSSSPKDGRSFTTWRRSSRQ